MIETIVVTFIVCVISSIINNIKNKRQEKDLEKFNKLNEQEKEQFETPVIEKYGIYNQTINNKQIQCEVCGKTIPYNEYGTCADCHKIIMERLKKRRI